MPKYVNLFSQHSVNESLEPPKQIAKVESADLVAADLLPTQNQLDPNKSIKHSLTKPDVTRNLFQRNPVMIKKPIIVFNSKYIMDGHHSWAECVINRPDDEVTCVNLLGEVDPITMLNHVKKRLRASADEIISKGMSSTLDLYTMDEDEIRQYVADHLTDACEEVYMEHGIQDVASHIVKGVLRLQEFNQPISGAVKRHEMPQFGSRDARRVALNNIHNSEISELKHIKLFESFDTTPPIVDLRSWYKLAQVNLVPFKLAKLSVEVYGNIPTSDVYTEAGYPDLDKDIETYGIQLTSRVPATYNEGTLKTEDSRYIGPSQNIKWFGEILEKIQQHYVGDKRKIEIQHFDLNVKVSKWAEDDWLIHYGLNEASYHDVPKFDDRITLDPAFIDRIMKGRKLIEAGLLPETQHWFDDKDNPRWIFSQHSGDRWTLVELDNEGRPITRNDSLGKYMTYTYQYEPSDYEKQEATKRAMQFRDVKGNVINETMVPHTDDPSRIPELAAQLREFARVGLAEYPISIDDTKGRIIYSEDEDGDSNRFTYVEKDGNTEMTCMSPDKKWYKEWTNSAGQVYRFENFTGYWEEVEFNGQPKADAYKNSQGKWWKKIWNDKGELVSIQKDPETTKKERDEESARNRRLGGNRPGRKPKSRTYEQHSAEELTQLRDLGLASPYSALEHMTREALLQYADPVQPIIDDLKIRLQRCQNSPNRHNPLNRLSIMHQITDLENTIAAMSEIVKAANAEVFILKINHDGANSNHSWSETRCHIAALPGIDPMKWGEWDTIHTYENSDNETIETIVFDPNDTGGLVIFAIDLVGKPQTWSEFYYSPDAKYPYIN